MKRSTQSRSLTHLAAPAAALLLALAGPAVAVTGGSVELNETTTQARKHQLQAKEQCDELAGAARRKCRDDAKAAAKQAQSEAKTEFRESEAKRKARVSDAHAGKRDAQAECRSLQGKARDDCVREARGAEKAQVAAAQQDAGEAVLDTQRRQALERCKDLGKAKRASCEKEAHARYGK